MSHTILILSLPFVTTRDALSIAQVCKDTREPAKYEVKKRVAKFMETLETTGPADGMLCELDGELADDDYESIHEKGYTWEYRLCRRALLSVPYDSPYYNDSSDDDDLLPVEELQAMQARFRAEAARFALADDLLINRKVTDETSWWAASQNFCFFNKGTLDDALRLYPALQFMNTALADEAAFFMYLRRDLFGSLTTHTFENHMTTIAKGMQRLAELRQECRARGLWSIEQKLESLNDEDREYITTSIASHVEGFVNALIDCTDIPRFLAPDPGEDPDGDGVHALFRSFADWGME